MNLKSYQTNVISKTYPNLNYIQLSQKAFKCENDNSNKVNKVHKINFPKSKI